MRHSFFKEKQQKGQGLVEYAMILVLVAIVVIGALMVLGPIIGNSFSTINSSLATVGSQVYSTTDGDTGITYYCHSSPPACGAGLVPACMGTDSWSCIP